ncbi:MAG: hypothetical protein COB67_02620 [SAR324 cluster bacterium]|uniref:SMODS and SLOG-associating 2TM effector domain-containing protein n=1 Tax=SAR324 cluster bacterium TaxID=2024889 RepID=A0A2A4TA57_9DELT|nr:MAG: hypothetical protein COB67_02620 [SAR324 cluster bacterium]
MRFSRESYRYTNNPFEAFMKRFEDIQNYWLIEMRESGLTFSQVFSEKNVHTLIFYIFLFIALYGLIEVVLITENKALHIIGYIFCIIPVLMLYMSLYLKTGLEIIDDMINNENDFPASVKKRAYTEYVINRDLAKENTYDIIRYIEDQEFREKRNIKAGSDILHLTKEEKDEVATALKEEVNEHLKFMKKSMLSIEFVLVASLLFFMVRSFN